MYTHLLPYSDRCVSGPTARLFFSWISYHSVSLTACCVHSPRCVLTPFNVLISVGCVVSCVKSSPRSPRSAQSCDEILGTPDNYGILGSRVFRQTALRLSLLWGEQMFILVQALVSKNWGPLETGSGKVLIIPLFRNTSRRVDGVQAVWSYFKFCLF